MFSGAVSDWIGKRKLLVLLGYGLAAVTKPLFPMATGIGAVLIARFVDRIGKGIRGAPRDALIADVTPVNLRGTAFGLRQSLDTVGAFVGPLLAMLLTDQIDTIQMHLKHIAEMFSEGNFSTPHFVHDQTPPGVPTMKRLKSAIHYSAEPLPNGGCVKIETSSPEGIAAVHDFLRFQIKDHETRDPTTIQNH